MNIVIKEDKNTKNKQPKVYDLGNVTTTIQDLLDNSRIVINGEQTIILKIDDNFYLLNLKDYKNNDVYGLGSNVLESDLICIYYPLNHVSATIPGIVNNTSLQELGGVDKKINGVRIGRGNASVSSTVLSYSSGTPQNIGSSCTVMGSNSCKGTIAPTNSVLIGDSIFSTDLFAANNTVVGSKSLKASSGTNNVAFGYNAGTLDANSNINENSLNCTYIGADCRTSSSTTTHLNEIVIGNGAASKGNNTTVIGNNSTLNTYLKGILNIANVPVYLNNADAITAGLLTGDVYRTSVGILMIVY